MRKSYFLIPDLILVAIMLFSGCTLYSNNDEIIIHKDQEGDYFKQLSIINAAVRENLDKPIFYYKRAYFFWENNKLNQGIKDIETAIQLDSSQANYFYLYAQILKNRQEYSKALVAIQKALKMGISELPIYVLATELYYRENQPSESQRYLRLAESFNIEIPELQYWKAKLALDRHDTLTAFPILQRVIGNDSSHKESWLALSNYYEEAGQADKAVNILIKATPYIELEASLIYKIAARCDSIFGLDSAFVWYKKAAQLPGTNFDINYKCAQFHIDKKEYEKAVPYYEKALIQKTDFDFGHFQLGYIYEIYKDELDAALNNYQKALNIKSDSTYNKALNRVKRKIANKAVFRIPCIRI